MQVPGGTLLEKIKANGTIFEIHFFLSDIFISQWTLSFKDSLFKERNTHKAKRETVGVDLCTVAGHSLSRPILLLKRKNPI